MSLRLRAPLKGYYKGSGFAFEGGFRVDSRDARWEFFERTRIRPYTAEQNRNPTATEPSQISVQPGKTRQTTLNKARSTPSRKPQPQAVTLFVKP